MPIVKSVKANKIWKYYPTKEQLCGHLPPFLKTRYAGHCWRNKNEFISDILLWTSTHWYTNVDRPIKTTFTSSLSEKWFPSFLFSCETVYRRNITLVHLNKSVLIFNFPSFFFFNKIFSSTKKNSSDILKTNILYQANQKFLWIFSFFYLEY